VTDPAERRFALTLAYDGSAFHGWQAQPDVVTVQSTLEDILSRIFDRPTRVVAAGRTDRGVHATGQVVSFRAPATWTAPDLMRSVNALLPDSVHVGAASAVPPDFHARYSAVARGYVYRVGTAPATRSPFLRRYCWPVEAALDRGLLDEAARDLVGERSFGAFAKAGQEQRGDRCAVRAAFWAPWQELGIAFHVIANRFLHHMVRYLVGTMVEVARGRRPASDLAGLLEGDPDLVTSAPAAPGGLFLARVYYDSAEA
jgi:tRNA pseudouridine38-40 synthase